jgi:hypothetical protein
MLWSFPRTAAILAATLLNVSTYAVVFADPPDFPADVLPVLKQNCSTCHNATHASGGIDLTLLYDSDAVRERYDLWKKAVKQVQHNTMPPDEALNNADRQLLLGWHQSEFFRTDERNPGPAMTRQLTRNEYANTVRDLLHVNFDASGEAGIPQENVVDGFPNRTAGLVLESTLMEKYFTAADLALEHLFTHPGAGAARKQLLGVGPSKELSAKEAVRQVLSAFVRRAFRRPPTEPEVERYAVIADEALKAGHPFELAIRKAMKPILVSPHFLLRVEMTPGKDQRIGDHELAVRLSYFLWSTMPDDELFALADGGKLSQRENLEKQVRRMLAHPKASALTTQFLAQWLQLPHLQKALPSQNQFPTYTRSLRDAMGEEIRLFCNHLRTADRSLLEFLEADYTFANAELARHYGLATIPEKGFEKVSLRPQDHRGGLPGMAGILTMTSHTDRTKPTARGKWILDVILGSPPPPPPAAAGSFAPLAKDRPEPASFREKLAQHASDPNCTGCHLKIDPLGFALENYDAIGSWRDKVGDTPVDNLGMLPGVGEFQGVDGLRTVLKTRQLDFVENLVAQTLCYALGRELSYYDEPSVQAVVHELRGDEYRFSTLILSVVQSHPFQHRNRE